MAVAFNRFSWWLWGVKDVESPIHATASPLHASATEFGSGLREPDSVKFPPGRGGTRVHSSSRRARRKWQSREERRKDHMVDREYDLVLVPSDGGCLSGSESDDSDWSIGWLEPHASDFLCDDEGETSFAVLVPCYGRGRTEMADDVSNNRVLGAIVSSNFAKELSSDSQKFVEEWLSSLNRT